jgi:hypothetical protein
MAIDAPKEGTPANFQSDRGGQSTIYKEPVIGIVKNNVDPTHSGTVWVYLATQNSSSSPDDDGSWTKVRYLSPFWGSSGVSGVAGTGSTTDGYGKFVGNPQSYGFWASAPDIGTQVVCIFINGKIDQGYYIGCIPQIGLLSMTPAIGSSKVVVPNDGEATTYGGADRLPVGEVNSTNPNLANSGTIVTDPKPVHSYQAAILFQQGLIRDNARGVISSSAQRETPSRVFGMSTPGGPIYQGGYNNSNIKSAATGSTDPSKLTMVGRTGGHSLVMDDGDLQGQDQLTRIRTSSGHMIMMNDSSQSLFIMHANGQSWIELGKEGTVDMYASNSVNIRTQGDLNLHADRDLNLHADRNFTLYGKNLNMESDNDMNIRSGANFSQYASSSYTVKSGSDLALFGGGSTSLAGSGSTYVNGKKIYLNSGNSGTTPTEIPVIPKVNHPDTTYSTEKGWMYPSPHALLSVTSRAPTHMPWIASGKGVDVSVSSSTNSSKPTTTPAVAQVNNSSASSPKSPTNPSTISTVNTPTGKTNPVPEYNAQAQRAAIAQNATSNGTLPTGGQKATAIRGTGTVATVPQVALMIEQNVTITEGGIAVTPYVAPADTKRGEGILDGPGGMTLEQACGPGMAIKPGSKDLLQTRLAQGMPMDKAIQGLVTGNLGATDAKKLLTDPNVQTQIIGNSLNNAATSLVNAGILTGAESAAQAGGLVLAASNFGVNAVTGLVNGAIETVTGIAQGVTNVITGTIGAVTGTIAAVSNIAGEISSGVGKISDMLAGGKFAGQLSDSISNGVTGLANSVKGAISTSIDSLGKSLTGLVTGLESTLRGAFKTVEASFKNLSANTPNILGGKGNASSVTDLSTPGAKYQSAQAALDVSQSKLDDAQTAYRNNPDEINSATLSSAESALSDARKTAASASLGVITGGVDSVISGASKAYKSATDTLSKIVSSPATTLDSGINALPGGSGSIVNNVATDAGTNIVNNVKNIITSSASTITGATVGAAAGAAVGSAIAGLNPLTNPVGLVGNLVNNTTNAITGAVNGVVNGATNLVTGVIDTATNLVTGTVNAAVGLVNGVLALPGKILNSITATANGILSSIQTALASIGNMGGQIKASIQAVETFSKTDLTSKIGTNLGDPRISIPLTLTNSPTPQVAESGLTSNQSALDQQAKALAKIKDIEEQIRQNDALIRQEVREAATTSLFAKLSSSYKQISLERDLEKANEEYQALVKNQNQAPPASPSPTNTAAAQSTNESVGKVDPRLTSGPTSKYFDGSQETPQQKYARLGSNYMR